MINEDQARQALKNAILEQSQLVLKPLDGVTAALELDPDTYLYPASMLKTPLAAATLELVERGELSLDQSFEVSDWNMTTNDAESPFVTGFRGPLSLIVERALTHSDNVATNMLYDICGRERATHIAQEKLRLPDTAFYRKLSGSEPLIFDPEWDGVNRNRHSARDAARLFELIATDALPYAPLLRDILAKQQFNDKLSNGLEPHDHFAHKTGDTDEVTHDGGILALPDGRRYIIVVYTGLESTPEHNARFGPFMREIRSLL
ncbi:MAG: serine hydrolase [Candidatus Eremiobacteraeota bacterium]|nr:serine hydrolase [Candidatus Eremiobacteraeota bacterium]